MAESIAAEMNINDYSGIGESSIKAGEIPTLNTIEMNMGYATGGKSLLGADPIKLNDITSKSARGFDMSTMFDGKNIGGTMSGIGEIAKAAAGIYDAHNKKQYQDKMFGMEKDRVERATARQDKQQANYEKVFG